MDGLAIGGIAQGSSIVTRLEFPSYTWRPVTTLAVTLGTSDETRGEFGQRSFRSDPNRLVASDGSNQVSLRGKLADFTHSSTLVPQRVAEDVPMVVTIWTCRFSRITSFLAAEPPRKPRTTPGGGESPALLIFCF